MWIAALAVSAVPALAAAQTGDPTTPPAPVFAGPAAVVDGDTLKIDGTRIRLFGIDAPEMSEWPWGPRARSALEELTDGRTVTCLQRDTDRYDRPVATCATAETPDLAEALIAGGLAITYRRFTAGTELHEAYMAAELAARAEGLGPAAASTTAPDRWIDTPGGGATIGVLGGLVAIVAGALINASLARRRDDRIRSQDTRSIAAELAAEFISAGSALDNAAGKVAFVASDDFDQYDKVKSLIRRPEFPIYRASLGRMVDIDPGIIWGMAELTKQVDTYCAYIETGFSEPNSARSWATEVRKLADTSRRIGAQLGEVAQIDPDQIATMSSAGDASQFAQDPTADHGDRQSGNRTSSE